MGEPTVWLTFLTVVIDTWQKEVGIYSGSQFKGTVQCDRKTSQQ